MTDQEIIQGLIARDNRVTEEFFFVCCRPLFLSPGITLACNNPEGVKTRFAKEECLGNLLDYYKHNVSPLVESLAKKLDDRNKDIEMLRYVFSRDFVWR